MTRIAIMLADTTPMSWQASQCHMLQIADEYYMILAWDALQFGIWLRAWQLLDPQHMQTINHIGSIAEAWELDIINLHIVFPSERIFPDR